jgi:hypothetical protein
MQQYTRERKFLTQAELAIRWRITESCVKDWRERGYLPYFRVPGSSRVLYPLCGIQDVERRFTTPPREVIEEHRRAEIKRKEPDLSATPKKEWRI